MAVDLEEYLANLERAGGKELRQGPAPGEQEMQRQKTLKGVEAALMPVPDLRPSEGGTTTIPGLMGTIAGIAPLVMPQSRLVAPFVRLGEAAPSVVRPFVPSLAASTAGTAAGVGVESALVGRSPLSEDFTKRMLGSLIENAVLDVGGNLAFKLGGDLIKVGKDQLQNFGITKGMFETDEQLARRAAQEWLSQRGATLTRGQLTGDIGTQQLEGALRFTTGGKEFAEQQAKVRSALQKGADDVAQSLETSDAFQMALKQGDPTQMAVGDRLQNALKTAEEQMKMKYQPVYQRLEKEGDGLFVNMKPIKDAAKIELDKLARSKFAGSGEDRAAVLRQILEQDDTIPLSVAHNLRSDLMAGARDLQKEGAPATVKEQEYNKQAARVMRQMDDIMVATFGNTEEKELARKLGMYGGIDQPAGLRSGQYLGYYTDLDKFLQTVGRTRATTANNELLREYFNAQAAYRDAMQGFYSGTIRTAIKAEPEAVGSYLFNTDYPSRLRDVSKAVAEIQKYLPKEEAKGIMQELQYGYLKSMLDTPESIAKLSKNLESPEFRQSFNYLFKNTEQRKLITDLANAAKFGMEETAGSTALRTRLISAGQAGLLGAAYLALPSDVTNKVDLPTALVTGGVLYLTPRFLSRALANKDASDALAMLSKGQSNPKYLGSVSAKIADKLNQSGIIDVGYRDEIDALFARSQKAQPQGQQAPGAVNLEDYLKQIESGQ
jgi:hypothetical protein